jgi:hypothetical protein
MLPRPYPKTRSKATWLALVKHLEKNEPLTDPTHGGSLAQFLWEEIYKNKLQIDFYWPRFWRGDAAVNSDRVLLILDQLRDFYVSLSDEYRDLLNLLPTINRWDAKADQRFYTEFVSRQMKAAYGHPFDGIVAALAGVALDLPEGVATETVRGRRRLGNRPEKSKRKTR